ncbi:LPD38 domain-containing protein [Sinorhizobium fredii]|uniref:LPD38 domain-containing protein n=1 Tax=Rhizobium fredii TaxID=380 RepID=UPI00351343BD
MADEEVGGINPFTAFQQQQDATVENLDPGLLDRFWTNYEAAQRYNTVLGATYDASTPSRQDERKRFDRSYETYPEWDGLLEGGAALSGQIAGTAASPENFIPIGLGEKILVSAKAGVTGLWARIFSGSVDAAAANAVADAAIQGIEIQSDFRERFDPVQYGAGILLGTAIGGGAAGAGKLIGDRAGRANAVAEAAAPSQAAEVPADNPFLPLQQAQAAGGAPEAAAVSAPAGASPAAAAVPAPVSRLPAAVEPAAAAETIGETLSARAAEARGLAVPADQVDRVAKSAVDVGKVPRRPQPLMDFLAAEGGLRDDGGELAAMGVSRKFVPGRGALVRAGGQELDKAREAAAQAGYFNHLYGSADEATAKSTVRDLLDLVDQENRGKPAYSMAEADRVAAVQDYENGLAARDDYRSFVDRIATTLNEMDAGVTLDDAVLARATDIMINEKLDPLDAFDRAILEEEARLEAAIAERGGSDGSSKSDAIPFFDDEPAGGSSQAGGRLGGAQQDGGSGGRRPHAADSQQSTAAGSSARSEDGVISGERALIQAAREQKQAGDFLMAQPLTGLRAQRTRTGAIATGAVERIARVRETAEALAKALDVAATRQGRISGGKRVRGTFDTRDSVVRVRSLDDFDVLTHEYGHHIDAKIPAVKAFIKKHSAELAKLDYDPVAGRDYEGFAEFFRLYLTNRTYVDANYASIATEFRQVLDQVPEMRDAIDAATTAWDEFLSAPSSVAVRSTIVSARKDGWVASAAKELKKSGLGGTIADVLQRIYTFGFDDLNPINRAVSYLQDLHLENKGTPLDLKVTADPYKLARMSRGAYAAGHMDVMYGVAPYRGINPASPSLRDAIIEATGKPNAMAGWDEEKVAVFGSYLWSRRAIGEWERYRKGEIPNPPDKLTEADHIQNVADLEAANPTFGSAAAKVHEFSRTLWRKKLEAGLIDQTTHDEGLLIRDYVPGLRDFSSDTDMKVPPGRSNGKTAKGGFARRFKGSKRDVINPLESLAADAYETAMAIARNDVVKALHRLAVNAGPGAGAIAEIVPAKELRATMIDPLEAIENAARAAGLSKPDIVVLRDAVESAVGAEKAAVFRPAIINEKGEPIAFFRDGGQLKALRLADGKFGLDMYRTIVAMSQQEKNFWLELVAVPARILRAGITTSFEFIGANFVRDQAMASVYYGKPLQRIANTLRGGGDEVLGKEIARSYSRVYGISGGSETASLAKVMAERDIAGLRRKGWIAQRFTSFRGVLEAVEISETATRLGLFRTFQQEAKARGLSEHEALFEAAYRARDYLDFDRRGSGMAALARVIPFLNVALQGLDKAGRHMITPVARKVLGQATTAEDARAAALAAKTWARLAVLVTGSVSLYALMSRHEDHDEISETTRSTHWMVKTGDRWTAIPKPFEFATAINLGEAMFDAMVRKDPSAAGRWWDSLATTLTPPSLLEGNPAIKTYFELKSNTNFFTDAPIVPEHLRGMEPFLQYTERTSAFSKQLGGIFNVSPAVSDHLIASFGGSWGRNLLSLYDLAQPDAPAAGWDDVPFARRFIKDAAKGAQSTTMFWELAGAQEGKLEGKALSWRELADAGNAAGAADFYAGLDQVEKAYVAVSTHEASVKRLHPIIRARGAIQAIGAMRRELAGNDVRDADGEGVAVTSAERGAADDILSDLSMVIARNALREAGVSGWAQRSEIDETGYYRELEALNPALIDRLGSGYAGKKVWNWEALKSAWPSLRDRLLEDGSEALVDDLVADVESEGLAVDGVKAKRREKPELVPG